MILNTNDNLFNLGKYTTETITYLSEVIHGNKRLYTIGSYHFFPLYSALMVKNMKDITKIKEFLEILDRDKGYIILPLLLSKNKSSNLPTISLSKQIIVSRNSNPKVILEFLSRQIIELEKNYSIESLTGEIVLKFRPITLNKAQVNRISRLPIILNDVTLSPKIFTKLNNPLHNGTIIPLTMDLEYYGTPLGKAISYLYKKTFGLDLEGTFFQKDGYLIYVLETKENNNKIQEVKVYKDRVLFCSFKNIPDNLNREFTRVFEDLKIHIKNNRVNFFEKDKKASFLKTIKNNKKVSKNIVTFDIETFQKEGKFVSYACGWYTGEICMNYYLTDYADSYEMLKVALTELLISNPKAKVYTHNLAKFDYLLICKILFENFEVDPIFKDNKLLKLTYSLKGDKNKIEMFDSYLILPSSCV